MTPEEFGSKNIGKVVQLKKGIENTEGWHWTKDWVGFEGVVEGFSIDGVKIRITKTTPSLYRNLGEISTWGFVYLAGLHVIEDATILSIPENNHPCPKCNLNSCLGMARIECLISGR